ncbi:MAG: 2-C-methyl-D-erythritol 2,4-cyclodiphosphate synthase [Candidatus Dormibacteraeota bacterium]|nr:2-C-methyl-D-erythritol 2,4-cyclodiphosphate synthase [Candidatus Dormibacteraeota bacterium]
MSLRVGQGYDIHRLVPDRPLVLAGVTIPYDLGLEGHSDGDAICHALADAMLGAAGLGDIGTHFPDENPRYQGADSLGLLEALAGKLAERGLVVHNADVTAILEVPRLGPYREAMTANLARALGVAAEDVGVKAKSNERLGPIGAGEAIAALAVVLIGPRDA